MRRALRTCWLALVLLMLFCRPGARKAPGNEFLPEVDAYLKLNPDIRVSFQAKDTREGGDSTQAEIGPSMEFYLKPLVRLKRDYRFRSGRCQSTATCPDSRLPLSLGPRQARDKSHPNRRDIAPSPNGQAAADRQKPSRS